jgi:hypothetical protein
VLVDSGDTLVNVLAHIDLNAVRANIVDRPEKYRWCSLAHHVQTGNADGFLSTDFGLCNFADLPDEERLHFHRKFVYEVGSLPKEARPPSGGDSPPGLYASRALDAH